MHAVGERRAHMRHGGLARLNVQHRRLNHHAGIGGQHPQPLNDFDCRRHIQRRPNRVAGGSTINERAECRRFDACAVDDHAMSSRDDRDDDVLEVEGPEVVA